MCLLWGREQGRTVALVLKVGQYIEKKIQELMLRNKLHSTAKVRMKVAQQKAEMPIIQVCRMTSS